MELTREKMDEVFEIVERKKEFYADIEFDEFGRVCIGTLPDNRTDDLEAFVKDFAWFFRNELTYILNENKWENINWLDIQDNTISVITTRGINQRIKISKIINKCKIWYKQFFNMESGYLNDMSKQLDKILGGTPDKLYLSINPLDMMVISGGRNHDIPLTTFTSCLSTKLSLDCDTDILQFNATGSFANTSTLYGLGCFDNRMLLYVPNSNSYTYDGFTFHGYKERALLWSDGDRAYVETVYPTKSTKLRRLYESMLNSVLPTMRVSTITKLDNVDRYQVYDFMDGYNETYLDYSAMDYYGIYLLPKSRGQYNNSGDGMELPSIHTCINCGDDVDEDDSYNIEGDIYCNYCFHEEFTFCSDCDEIIPRDEAYYWDDDAYCESCFDHRSSRP